MLQKTWFSNRDGSKSQMFKSQVP